MSRPPNILYVHSHDTGRFVQPYGHPVSTPNLQRFAEQGVLLRQAFCASPTCSPSRAALLTGQYPHRCGVSGLVGPPWNYELKAPRHLLMHTLAGAGYLTALAGLQHITRKQLEAVRGQGFAMLLNEDNLGEDVPDLHERAANFIVGAPEEPWFFSLGFDQTHRDNRQGNLSSGTCFSQTQPYDPTQLDARYCLPPPTVPDLPETRRDIASFKEGARRLDERIGHVLAALDASGRAEETLVIVTTDHGTLCELLRLPAPPWLDGKSLLPLVRGEVDTLHEEIFAEQDWHEQPEPQRTVRTSRYKYIRRFAPVGPKAANCDESPTKQLLAAAGFFDRALGDELLFDLYLDPQEACNRVHDPALAGVCVRLRQSLDAWMQRTEDPLLSGQPLLPPGLADIGSGL